MKKQRWRFTKYDLSNCSYCDEKIYILRNKNKKVYKAEDYNYCSSNCHMLDVDAPWSHFA